MDLNRVVIFLRVVEEQGFSAAARALGLPKSSVSRAVALLEEELGAALLRRSTRSVALTEAGRAFYERASRGLEAFAEARDAVVDLEAEVRVPVRITAPVDAGIFLLAPVVSAFTRLYPEVSVDVILTARVVDLVEDRIDLALRAGPLRDPTLVARKLAEVDFALFAAPSYLETHPAPRSVEELASHPCVLFRGVGGRATWSFTGPTGEVSVEVRGALTADDYAFVHTAVVAGAGVGLLPAYVGAADGSLVRVLPQYSVPAGPLHLVYPRTSYTPRRCAVFRDFVAESLGGRAVAPRPKRR